MKRLLCILTATTMFFGATTYGEGKEKINVNVDNSKLEFDVEPVIENGRVLVPFRAIFEKLGCIVFYNDTDGKQMVSAVRGDESVMFEIGANDMALNGNVNEIDVPAKIINGRTLVPLRAVSEALGAEVKWDSENRTVDIFQKMGEHKISSVTDSKVIKNNKGNELINISYVYPVIENADNNSFIAQINNEYKTYAENFVKEAEKYKEDAEELCNDMGYENYAPMEFNLSYKINADRKGIISITNYEYYNLGGVHPDTAKISHTYDINNQKELQLEDIVNGDEDERLTMIYDVFVKFFEENSDDFSSETAKLINDEAKNVKFYLTDDSLILYFDVYQVAPYATQYPTVELKYNKGVFKLDWSK